MWRWSDRFPKACCLQVRRRDDSLQLQTEENRSYQWPLRKSANKSDSYISPRGRTGNGGSRSKGAKSSGEELARATRGSNEACPGS